jgi:hypothetical protein
MVQWPAGVDGRRAVVRLRHCVDDGAAFYLNGVNIFSTNMPTTAWVSTNYSRLSVGTPALLPAASADLILQPAIILTNIAWQTGQNQLAVEVKQASGTSSDIAFGMLLTAIVPPYGTTVIPPVRPQMKNHRFSRAAGFAAEIDTESGKTYQLLGSPGISPAVWQPVGSVVGNGTRQTVIDPTPVSTNRFYRIGVQ